MFYAASALSNSGPPIAKSSRSHAQDVLSLKGRMQDLANMALRLLVINFERFSEIVKERGGRNLHGFHSHRVFPDSQTGSEEVSPKVAVRK